MVVRECQAVHTWADGSGCIGGSDGATAAQLASLETERTLTEDAPSGPPETPAEREREISAGINSVTT